MPFRHLHPRPWVVFYTQKRGLRALSCPTSRSRTNGKIRLFSRPFDTYCEGGLQHSMIGGLSKHALAFPLRDDSVNVLARPSDFFDIMKEEIRNSKLRIVISSLYIGTGPQEQELLDVLAESIEKHHSLHALLLFDALRSTRLVRPMSGEPGYKSSVEMLTHILLSEAARWRKMCPSHENRVKVALFRTPDLTRSLEKILPSRLNEVLGVCHMKVYVFDNNVLMTGANLSTAYFTNRQDRYILLKDCPKLADYLCDVVKAVASFSFTLNKNGVLENSILKIDPRTNPADFRNGMFKELERVQDFYGLKDTNSELTDFQGDSWIDGHNVKTWAFPALQMGPVGIYQDELCFLWLLSNLSAGSSIHFASAYFNLTREFEAALLQAATDKAIKILTAAPQANGFYGSRGISGLIPKAYSLLEKRFYERTCQMGSGRGFLSQYQSNLSGIQIFEYKRKDWTFHAKGLWGYLPSDASLPSMTVIGSSNFGFRSRQRDLEAQLYLVTTESNLRLKLQQETELLFVHGEHVHPTLFLEPDRSGGRVSLLAAQLVRSWL